MLNEAANDVVVAALVDQKAVEGFAAATVEGKSDMRCGRDLSQQVRGGIEGCHDEVAAQPGLLGQPIEWEESVVDPDSEVRCARKDRLVVGAGVIER